MTHQQNLETIRKACILSNPSIMELKFGCRVITIRNKPLTLTDSFIKEYGESLDNLYKCTDGLGYVQIKQILGREIRLSDVLLALDKRSEESLESEDDIQFDISLFDFYVWDGDFVIEGKLDGREYFISWPLKNDNLENISAETAQFLADLLGGTK